MKNLIVTPTALIINLREKIGLEKDMLVGVIQTLIQLTVVGYVLTYIIRIDRLWLTGLWP